MFLKAQRLRDKKYSELVSKTLKLKENKQSLQAILHLLSLPHLDTVQFVAVETQ